MSKRPKQAGSIGAYFCGKGHLHVTMFDDKNCVIANGKFNLMAGAELVMALTEQLEALLPDDEGEKATLH